VARTPKDTPTHKPFYKRKTLLALALNISRTTLDGLLVLAKCPPRHAEGWNFDEMRKFALEQLTTKAREAGGNDFQQLRMKEMAGRVARVELIVEKERGNFLARDSYATSIAACLSEFDSAFSRALFQDLPPQLEQKSAVEISKILREKYTLLKTELYGRIEEIK